jgi:hypothetical protein
MIMMVDSFLTKHLSTFSVLVILLCHVPLPLSNIKNVAVNI